MPTNDLAVPPAADNPAAWALTLIQTRQTVLPRRLVAPGPDAAQQQVVVQRRAAAPDHEQRLPCASSSCRPRSAERRGRLSSAH
jgi:hypothetical protein